MHPPAPPVSDSLGRVVHGTGAEMGMGCHARGVYLCGVLNVLELVLFSSLHGICTNSQAHLWYLLFQPALTMSVALCEGLQHLSTF